MFTYHPFGFTNMETLGEFEWPEDFQWPDSHSESMIYLGLVHDFGQMGLCGIELRYKDEDYAASKADLIAKGMKPCLEDILFNIVKMGNLWEIYDEENEETLEMLSLDQMKQNIRKMNAKWWMQFVQEQYDSETCNVALQCAFFGDIVYG